MAEAVRLFIYHHSDLKLMERVAGCLMFGGGGCGSAHARREVAAA